VLRETSTQVSFISILGMYSWNILYLGLSKRGVLYIFKTLYDPPEEAMVRIDLRSVDARVVGTPSSNVIKVFNGEVRFYLKFLSMEEFSSCLRQLSDFGVSAASRLSSASSTAAAQKTSQVNQASESNNGSRPSSQRAAAADDFSSTYGM
jgi:hypothetical protein